MHTTDNLKIINICSGSVVHDRPKWGPHLTQNVPIFDRKLNAHWNIQCVCLCMQQSKFTLHTPQLFQG